jgi:hypothetical protein
MDKKVYECNVCDFGPCTLTLSTEWLGDVKEIACPLIIKSDVQNDEGEDVYLGAGPADFKPSSDGDICPSCGSEDIYPCEWHCVECDAWLADLTPRTFNEGWAGARLGYILRPPKKCFECNGEGIRGIEAEICDKCAGTGVELGDEPPNVNEDCDE